MKCIVMKHVYSLLILVSFITLNLSAQTSADYTIQLSAQTSVSPPQIILNWKSVPGASQISIYRKTKTATSWGAAIGTVAGSATTYTDNTVIADSAYEYFVTKPDSPAYGYIYAGVRNPAIHSRGALLVLVDSALRDSCSAELTRLMKDISGDGWEVLRKDFNSTTAATAVKSYIVSLAGTNPNLRSVLIIGHIAVPYSGDLNPDAHPDHKGAWPADAYYGDINGTWTDVSVNDVVASRTQNKNTPGDGKFDQSLVPSDIELQVGRVDFNDMPAFGKTHVQMMKSYLNKDHVFKMDSLAVTKRALIDDNFGKFSGEAFGASGYRLSPIVGWDSIKSVDFIATLNTNSYLWAYGCGGGSYTSASGIGTTTNFTTNNVNAVFTMLFGSYFGDWDAQNNFLRAPLCSNTPALTCAWAGRPHWYFHHMALGENIGFSTITTQNNNNTYQNPVNYMARGVHIGLMGDPTLRTEYVKQARNVVVTNTPGAGAVVTWTASAGTGVIGYYVYRSATEFGAYEKRSSLVTATTYTDSVGDEGDYFYMVRAVKLQSTPSGSYYNMSIGVTDSEHVKYPYTPSSVHDLNNGHLVLYPNPANNVLNIVLNSPTASKADATIYDLSGRRVISNSRQLKAGENTITIDVQALPTGMYIAIVRSGANVYYQKWIKSE